jgi:8-amino-7-oxononanoate synthase
VESIYSVLGDASDLTSLAALAAEHDAVLVVDEAHGVGVAGGGGGAVHAAGLAGVEHVVMTATLSKALGAQGGAVLGSPLLREHLVSTARTFLFDTALAPAPAAAAAEACRIVRAEPALAAAVGSVAGEIAEVCEIEQAAGAVQSIPIGSPEAALHISQLLAEQGVLVGCFRPPSVPDGVSRLRLTARADLPQDIVRQASSQVASLTRAAATA